MNISPQDFLIPYELLFAKNLIRQSVSLHPWSKPLVPLVGACASFKNETNLFPKSRRRFSQTSATGDKLLRSGGSGVWNLKCLYFDRAEHTCLFRILRQPHQGVELSD